MRAVGRMHAVAVGRFAVRRLIALRRLLLAAVLPLFFASPAAAEENARQIRLSAEGGVSAKVFAAGDYGFGGRMLLAQAAVGGISDALPGLSATATAVRWTGPYTANTLIGGGVGYEFADDQGRFIRFGGGLFHGDSTARTATEWSAGLSAAVGMKINGGKNEIYAAFWHFSNGDKLGWAKTPNEGEEFIAAGVSFYL